MMKIRTLRGVSGGGEEGGWDAQVGGEPEAEEVR